MLKLLMAAVIVAGAFLPKESEAATITISDFTEENYSSAIQGSFTGLDFEALGAARGEGGVGPGLSTALGTFSGLGGTGSGGTVTGLAGNTGTELALRRGDVFGRSNTHPLGGEWYLDSNDTFGIGWVVARGGDLFDRIVFALTDGSEFGGSLRVIVGGYAADQGADGARSNGNTSLVTVDFDTPVAVASIQLGHFDNASSTRLVTNDGFSIDGVQVGIAPVPLPASVAFLSVGLGALVFLRRRARA